ncbi:hypothetical protein EW145_g2294 [Phellinidium pouzarii]|uniref:Ricin B lectin domain-containing protein n=1 Tax=Phellinidium pouzarii TaxID=167371 RepID=A0A4S4LBW9_9AGAM|nr:hypothetical protein EW145_g2294 [Phellinidium pouzarii]
MVALATIPPVPASAVTPTSGNNYVIQNLGTGHVLDDAFSSIADGNPILSDAQVPHSASQIWEYLTYPSSVNATVFTIQSLFTAQHEQNFHGRGGYARVDTNTNKLVQGGAPLAWTLVEAAPSLFQLVPFDGVISSDGKLVATDINSAINTKTPDNNQAQLEVNIESLEQLWTFNSA